MTVCVGRRALSVRMLTHSSNEPLPSPMDVNISSNPTVMTGKKELLQAWDISYNM